MENSVTIWEQKNMMAMLELRNIANSIKASEERYDEIRNRLLQGMEENNIVSIDNDYVTISHVAATPGKLTIDTKAWKQEEPEEYEAVFNRFNKMSGARKSYIRITTK